MLKINYLDYKITAAQENDLIGYALFTSGYINEDLSEIDPECICCMLNKEPLRDIAFIHGGIGEYFISKIHYSKRGNYLGDEQEFLTINEEFL